MFQKTHPSDALRFSSSALTNALDHHLHISSTATPALSVLCYDDVLCYLSNVVGHGSIDEIESNLQRYFTDEQLHRAYDNLRSSLDYALPLSPVFAQCLSNLSNPSCLLSTIQLIDAHRLLASLPVFVTNDWLNMIRNIQDLEKIDAPSSCTPIHLQEQMVNLKGQLSTLHQLMDRVRNAPSASIDASAFSDACCLRTYCSHASHPRFTPLIDSPVSSSWSSLDIDRTPLTTFNRPVPGFIRNPVSNFLMPMAPRVRNELHASMASIDDNLSSDDEPSINSNTGSIVVIRDDDLWIYPIGVELKKSTSKFTDYQRSRSMFASVNEKHDRHSLFSRRKSFDDEELSRHGSEKLQTQFKKHKKEKGAHRAE